MAKGSWWKEGVGFCRWREILSCRVRSLHFQNCVVAAISRTIDHINNKRDFQSTWLGILSIRDRQPKLSLPHQTNPSTSGSWVDVRDFHTGQIERLARNEKAVVSLCDNTQVTDSAQASPDILQSNHLSPRHPNLGIPMALPATPSLPSLISPAIQCVTYNHKENMMAKELVSSNSMIMNLIAIMARNIAFNPILARLKIFYSLTIHIFCVNPVTYSLSSYLLYLTQKLRFSTRRFPSV